MIKRIVIIAVVLMLALTLMTSAESLENKQDSDVSGSVSIEDSEDGYVAEQNDIDIGEIDKNAVASVASIDPGEPMSWNELSKKNINKPLKIKDIQTKYDIEKDKLDKLKKERYTKPKDEPFTITEDTYESGPQPLAPSLVKNFEGLDFQDSRPPDPDIAAGINHVGVVVNTEVAFYTKAGNLVGTTDLETWFNNVCPGCFPFDPRIVYDKKEGHWIIIALEMDPSSQYSRYLISVSQTSDPLGSWWNYNLAGNLVYNGVDTWADYDDIAFDSISSTNGGAVYVTSNQFTWSDSFRTSMLNILPKSVLYTGGVLGEGSYWRVSGMTNVDGTLAFTLRPAVTLSNTNGEFLVNTKSSSWDKVTLWRVVPTYPPTPVNLKRRATLTIGSYNIPPDAKQPGCISLLSTIDNRLYNAVYMNKNLYTAFTERYDWGTPSNVEAAIRYLKINTTSNSVEINKKYGKDNLYYWFPAITADKKGNITLVFARGNSTEYGGIHYTGQKISEADTEPSNLLKAGEECITGYRWGDYFGIANDPTNDRFTWIYGEWAKNVPGVSSVWDWGTWIGKTRHYT